MGTRAIEARLDGVQEDNEPTIGAVYIPNSGFGNQTLRNK